MEFQIWKLKVGMARKRNMDGWMFGRMDGQTDKIYFMISVHITTTKL